MSFTYFRLSRISRCTGNINWLTYPHGSRQRFHYEMWNLHLSTQQLFIWMADASAGTQSHITNPSSTLIELTSLISESFNFQNNRTSQKLIRLNVSKRPSVDFWDLDICETQIIELYIKNVTLEDFGVYRCDLYRYPVLNSATVNLVPHCEYFWTG